MTCSVQQARNNAILRPVKVTSCRGRADLRPKEDLVKLCPCAAIRAAVRVVALFSLCSSLCSPHALRSSSGGAFNGELWGLLLIKSLGTSHFCPAGAACGNGASAAQGICVGESPVRFLLQKKSCCTAKLPDTAALFLCRYSGFTCSSCSQ